MDTVPGMTDNSDRMGDPMGRVKVTRRRLIILCSSLLAATVVVAAAGAATGDGDGGTANSAEPDASLLQGGERAASAAGDSVAADRLLRAGGWRPAAGSLHAVATARTVDGDYGLFAYRSDSTLHLLAVGDQTESLGGVHGTCHDEQAAATVCGSAVEIGPDGRGHALVIGTAPGAQRVAIDSADATPRDALFADGMWFARVAIDDARDSAPRTITVWGQDGQVDRIAATELDAHITSVAGLTARQPTD